MLQETKRKKQISICIYDCRQCFDSMWQAEVTNDIFEAGVKDDKLAFLHELNKVNYMSVKTQYGLTKRTEISEVICQGDPWGLFSAAYRLMVLAGEV